MTSPFRIAWTLHIFAEYQRRKTPFPFHPILIPKRLYTADAFPHVFPLVTW